ncbi:glycosyl transferase [Bacillus sp. RJGP41]|nr:glycosyl transferase [Bacillus sp. RJGP41]
MGTLNKFEFLLKKPKSIIKILGDKRFLNWLPSRQYLKMVYWGETGKKLNLVNPLTFNEKLQWLKLYDWKPEYSMYVDKYSVRSYIEETLGDQYFIPIIGLYKNVQEINWDTLPEKFVLKCTHGSGSNIICTSKSKFDIDDAKIKLSKWMKKNWYWFGREGPYKNIIPRIVCEQYMVDDSGTGLKDYKFMCFNGEAKCIFVCQDRNSSTGLNIDIYDINWNLMPFQRPSHPNSGTKSERPKNYEKMIEFAQILSKDIPFLRVDFYEINGHLYFGELTFYPGSGFEEFTPESYDKLLGSWIKLPK